MWRRQPNCIFGRICDIFWVQSCLVNKKNVWFTVSSEVLWQTMETWPTWTEEVRRKAILITLVPWRIYKHLPAGRFCHSIVIFPKNYIKSTATMQNLLQLWVAECRLTAAPDTHRRVTTGKSLSRLHLIQSKGFYNAIIKEPKRKIRLQISIIDVGWIGWITGEGDLRYDWPSEEVMLKK